jgi:small conductance mechanosensitive channel
MPFGPDLDWVSLLGGGASLEGRITLTVIAVLLAAIVGRIVVHWVIRGVGQLFSWLFRKVGVRDSVGPITQTDVTNGIGLFGVRLLQLGVLGGLVVVVMAIWGRSAELQTFLSDLSVPIPALVKAGFTLLLLVGAYTAMNLLHRWVAEVTARSSQISDHQEEIWLRVLQIIVLVAALIASLAIWGIDLGGLLVGAGFLGIVAGLAAQQTLGALIAGFVLMLSRPFEIGDWVQIGEEEGIVTEITIVNTRLENFDGEVIALPNDSVSNSTIVNRSKKGRLRLRVDVGIDYDANPEYAREVAVEALEDVERVLSVPKPRVVISRFGDSAIVLELRFWIDKPSARRRALATNGAIRAVNEAFREAGVKIPFPQRELSGRAETDGFRIADGDDQSK